MKKGIFWCRNYLTEEAELLIVAAECDRTGNALDPEAAFSSKSGKNFNHRIEWQRMERSVTQGFSFDHWPRGRVEIRNGRATVFLNPDLNTEEFVLKLTDVFGLNSGELESIRIVNDGSIHYRHKV